MAAEVYSMNVERLRKWASRRLSAYTIGKQDKKGKGRRRRILVPESRKALM